jgi:diguanylate cyclase (GGDEF)-like protein
MTETRLNELKSKTKEELIELLGACEDNKENINNKIHVINTLDKLSEYPSLQSHIEKIQKSSNNVSIMMFKIYNLDKSDKIYDHPVSANIVQDITKLLKSRIRDTDILIKYNEQNFVIIAPNTNIDGISKYATKLNNAILSHKFAHLSNLQSNFTITSFNSDDSMHSVINRLLHSLVDIEKDLKQHILKV